MRRFRDLPIRRRVNFLIIGASALGLILASLGVMVYDLRTLKLRVLTDATAQADIVSVNTLAALAFHDTLAAGENLATLRARPDISAAAIFDTTGSLFASYARTGTGAFPFRQRHDSGAAFAAHSRRRTLPKTLPKRLPCG